MEGKEYEKNLHASRADSMYSMALSPNFEAEGAGQTLLHQFKSICE